MPIRLFGFNLLGRTPPGCRSAALQGLKQGVDAIGDALGLGEPDGSSSSPAGSEAGSGLAGIFAGILGLVDKIVQDMNDLIVRSVPNEGSGGGGPGPGDGDEGDDDPGGDENRGEKTPTSNPDDFRPIRGRKGKLDPETGEIWERDQLHKDHWEVYEDYRRYERGIRDRAVWNDGRLKQQF